MNVRVAACWAEIINTSWSWSFSVQYFISCLGKLSSILLYRLSYWLGCGVSIYQSVGFYWFYWSVWWSIQLNSCNISLCLWFLWMNKPSQFKSTIHLPVVLNWIGLREVTFCCLSSHCKVTHNTNGQVAPRPLTGLLCQRRRPPDRFCRRCCLPHGWPPDLFRLCRRPLCRPPELSQWTLFWVCFDKIQLKWQTV